MNWKYKILFTYLAPLFMWPISSGLNESFHDDFVLVEVPTLRVNVYLMGSEQAPTDAILKIKENINFLNSEFEGRLKFEHFNYFSSKKHEFLPDIHNSYIDGDVEPVDKLVEGIEKQGYINIYVFNTYADEELDAELMGFTPVMSAMHKYYEQTTPEFDRIFLSYSALSKKTTLIHEMGHFLGLSHPWEMNEINLDLMGMQCDSGCSDNHMSYGPDVQSFTLQQLERMRDFAINFRSYLILKKELKYMPPVVF